MEWLDSRRDAEYTQDDAPSEEVYEAWFHDTTMMKVMPAVWFLYHLVDWAPRSGRLKNDLGDVLRARTAWQHDRVKRVKTAGPWQEAVKEAFTNLITT